MGFQESVQELNSEITTLRTEILVLKLELKSISSEMKDLKLTNKLLIEFMYKNQGGKAMLFGLITMAASIGAVFSTLAQYVLHLGK